MTSSSSRITGSGTRWTWRRWTVVTSALSVAIGYAWLSMPAAHGQVVPQGNPTCVDNDGDGYGSPGDATCDNGAAEDCNDDNPNINPNAAEICNGVDDNCDGSIDEGFDVDGDGFTTCAGDCNDSRDDVYPDAPELCDGVDNNCNGSIDEGFAAANVRDGDENSATFNQFVDSLPLGAKCINGFGICAAYGVIACSQDGSEAICNAVPGPAGTEGPAGDPTCFDRIDNDCDGLTDFGNPDTHEDTACTSPEVCDGFDNDNDGVIDNGFDLGGPCSVGVGLCARQGSLNCNANGGVSCDATPLDPREEGPPGGPKCQDGLDNDCDGKTDIADEDCRSAEICDGLDNNGDGSVDEVFSDLGTICTSGIGPCQRSGHKICSADGSTTVCDAVAGKPSPEGPQGATCDDGIDNDCDGFVDFEDPSCGGANLAVSCTLKPGICKDCVGWYTIDYAATGSDRDITVTAELLAVNADNEVLARLPVERGDTAKLAALTVPDDCVVARSIDHRHEVFAPVPLLRVVAEDGLGKAVAYCSNTPYLEVVEPAGQVVSASEGDVIPVSAAVPLVDPAALFIKVDGADLVDLMGLDPAADFPGGPYDGVVDINGTSVTVSQLTVRTEPLGSPSSNTVSFQLAGMGCGEHIIVMDGEELPGAQRMPRREACYMDDLHDKGTASVFEITISSPTEGSVVGNHPDTVNVQGEACHGHEITGVTINRFAVDVGNQASSPGDGENVGAKFTVPINVDVPVNDLRDTIDTGQTLPGFDPGPNRLVAQAIDGDFNTTYDNLFFAVGPVVAAPDATAAIAGGPGEVQRAFTLAISTAGMNTFFDAFNNRNKRDIGSRVRDAFNRLRQNKKFSVDDACDPPTVIKVTNSDFEGGNEPPQMQIHATPEEGKIPVRIDMPNIFNRVDFDGYCESDCVCAFGGCVCGSCVTVDMTAQYKRTGMFLAFDVTEERLVDRTPLDLNFNPGDSDNGVKISGDVDVGCLAGFFLDVANFLGQVITFGLWDPGLGHIDIDLTGDDMKDRFNGLDGDPMSLDLVKFENRDLPDFGTRQRESRISEANIDPNGVAVALSAAFEPEPSEIDPNAQPIPGTPLKNAPLPIPPIVDAAGNPAGHVTIAISDDVFNQLFYSAAQTGRLATGFDVVRQLRQFLPSDCTTIADETRQARCVGMRGEEDCDVVYDPPLLPVSENQRVRELRRVCRRAARIDRNFNIGGGTALILHGRMEVPSQILFNDNPATPDVVEVIMRTPQISVKLIADRDGDGVLDASSLDSLPACAIGNLEEDAPTQSIDTTECVLWETCLAAEMQFDLELTVNDRGKERIKFSHGQLIRRDDPFGVLCQGGVDVPELDFFNDEASQTEVLDSLETALDENTPPLDTDGLGLGGLVTFVRDRLIAIETQDPADDDGFQDYIGITGNIVPSSSK